MRAVLLVALAIGCTTSHPIDVAPDAPSVDASRDASFDAPRDAPSFDAPRDTPPARARDPRLPPLLGRCDPLSFDLDDPSTYDTPRDLALAFRTIVCARQLRCGDPGGAVWCDPIYTGAPPGYVVPIDTALARTCLEAALAFECEGPQRLPDRCIELEWDPLPDGSACSRDDGCRSGYCADAAPSACTGHCAPEPACPPCAPTERCVHGRCEPLIPVGESCLFNPWPCVPGAYCNGERCAPLPAPFERCGSIAGPLPSFVCGGGHACRGGVCLPFETAEVGAACDAVARCVDGADCVEGTCRRRPAEGEPCDRSQFCAGTLYCGERGVCARMVAPGCACDETVTCTVEHRCIDGVCQRIGVEPTPCELGCPDRWCVAGTCDIRFEGERCRDDACNEEHAYCDLRTQTCEPVLYPGEDCSAHPDACFYGRCVEDVCVPDPRDPCHP